MSEPAHLDDLGTAGMVDFGAKKPPRRIARAEGSIAWDAHG